MPSDTSRAESCVSPPRPLVQTKGEPLSHWIASGAPCSWKSCSRTPRTSAPRALAPLHFAEPAQDAHDGAAAPSGRRQTALQHARDLVRAPARMLIAQRENRENDVLTGTARARVGPPALLDQAQRSRYRRSHLCPVCRETPNSSQSAERLLPFCAARSTN